MENIGILWGVAGVVLTVLAIMRFILLKFYDFFIRGLSKRNHREIIDKTIILLKIFEDDHSIFALGSIVSIGFHAIIMVSYRGVDFFSVMVGIVFTMVFIIGIICRFIYRDKSNNVKRCHVIVAFLYVIALLLHIKFS